LVDQSRTTLHQSITNPVHGLYIQLFLGLDLHKTHILFPHRFGDRFGSLEVVLVGFSIRFHELGWDQLYLVPLFSRRLPRKCEPAQASMLNTSASTRCGDDHAPPRGNLLSLLRLLQRRWYLAADFGAVVRLDRRSRASASQKDTNRWQGQKRSAA